MIFDEEKFNMFRREHPQLRFWQALREYLKVDRIEVVYAEDEEMVREDTYYWYDDK